MVVHACTPPAKPDPTSSDETYLPIPTGRNCTFSGNHFVCDLLQSALCLLTVSVWRFEPHSLSTPQSVILQTVPGTSPRARVWGALLPLCGAAWKLNPRHCVRHNRSRAAMPVSPKAGGRQRSCVLAITSSPTTKHRHNYKALGEFRNLNVLLGGQAFYF